jgi:hypothetical protein
MDTSEQMRGPEKLALKGIDGRTFLLPGMGGSLRTLTGSGDGDGDVGSTRTLSSGECRRVAVDRRRDVEPPPPPDPRQGRSAMIRTRVREVRSQEFGTTGGGGVGLGCGGPQRSRVEGSEGHGRCRGCAAVGGKGGERARNDDESTGEGVSAGGVAREDVGEGEVTCDSSTRREGLAGRWRRRPGHRRR